MTDEELERRYDNASAHTVVGTNFYLEELRRRALDRATAAALEEARASRHLARTNMLLAVTAIVVALIAIAVQLITA